MLTEWQTKMDHVGGKGRGINGHSWASMAMRFLLSLKSNISLFLLHLCKVQQFLNYGTIIVLAKEYGKVKEKQ